MRTVRIMNGQAMQNGETRNVDKLCTRYRAKANNKPRKQRTKTKTKQKREPKQNKANTRTKKQK